jgi:hypothetical protein
VKLPLMYMTGTLDKGGEGQDAAWRRSAYESTPPSDKYYVEIEGARHLSFTGRVSELDERMERPRDQRGSGLYGSSNRSGQRAGSGMFEKERRIFNTIKASSLAFWDAYLLDKAAAKEYLQSKRIEELNSGGTVLRK